MVGDSGSMQLFQRCRIDPAQGSSTVDEPLVDHGHRHSHRGRRGPLSGTGLEDVEDVLFDGELDVAHVPVVVLQAVHDLDQLPMAVGVEPGELVEGQGVP